MPNIRQAETLFKQIMKHNSILRISTACRRSQKRQHQGLRPQILLSGISRKSFPELRQESVEHFWGAGIGPVDAQRAPIPEWPLKERNNPAMS
jgi:hypothetical protein